MIPPQPNWDDSRRPSAFCRECECETNHTTKEHQEAQETNQDDVEHWPAHEWPEDGGEA